MSLPNTPAWTSGLPERPPLPVLQGNQRAAVCVVGLGGSGLAAIRRLQELGITDVVGLDAGQVAGAAAGRNGGLLLAGLAAFHHQAEQALGTAEAVRWYLDTQEEQERMLDELPGFARLTGSLRIASDAAELEDCLTQSSAMRAAGLPVEEYDGAQGQGLHFPQDAVFNPLARHRALADLVKAGGARLFEHSKVTDVRSGLVTTSQGRIDCQAVLVAVDGHLAHLLPELAADVKPLRLQMLATAPTHEVRFEKPVYYRHGFEYWQQLEDGRVLLGGFRDRGGAGEWSAPAEPGDVVQEQLESFLRQHLQVHGAMITHRWAATVGYRHSLLPYHGKARPGVWAAGGYNGTGNVVGSLLGRRLAEEITAAV